MVLGPIRDFLPQFHVGTITPSPGPAIGASPSLAEVSVELTEPPDFNAWGRYSAILISRFGGLDPNSFDTGDVPLNAVVAYNPSSDQLIIVPTQLIGNDTYLLALSNIKGPTGDALLNSAGQPAGVNGNASYYAQFTVTLATRGRKRTG
jgi:hypothetical protein